MKIDENTKFIARLHKKISPRTLNAYNPFFEDKGINAVYGLFYDSDVKKLVDGVRNLKFAGALTPGFEVDPSLAGYLDELDETSKISGHVSHFKNVDGKLVGAFGAGKGLYKAIVKEYDLNGKNVVIVGSGTVCKTFLYEAQKMNTKFNSLKVFSRDIEKIHNKLDGLGLVFEAHTLQQIQDCSGDILINISDIGGSVEDALFTNDIVEKFDVIVDITFEVEYTKLMNIAKSLGKKYITGWRTFTQSGAINLGDILGIEIDPDELDPYVVKGLTVTTV